MRPSIGYPLVAIVCLVSGLVSGARLADSHTQRQALETVTKTVSGFSHQGMTIQRAFHGPGGLIGLILEDALAHDKTSVAWASPDGKALILGSVVDETGRNYTLASMQALGMTPAAAPAPRSLSPAQVDEVKTLATQHLGNGSKEVWVFLDPLCPHCRDFYREIQTRGSRGYKVHAILVDGIGGQEAARLAGLVLDHRISLEEALSGDPLKIQGDPSPDAATRIAQGRALLVALTGSTPTPTSVVQVDQGQYTAISGAAFLGDKPNE